MDYREVTVIIPFLNAEKTIEECVSSLLNQTYPSEKTKLLFVDNGSTDQSVKKLKKLLFTHILLLLVVSQLHRNKHF